MRFTKLFEVRWQAHDWWGGQVDRRTSQPVVRG